MRHSLNLKLVASIILLAMTCGPTAPLRTVAQGPPTNVDDTFTVDGICAFPVLVELKGKSKTIDLPGGRAIFTSPRLTATLTNLDRPANHETFGVTGAFHQTVLQNGDVESVVTGRNLLIGFDPEGFVISIGRFRFVLDANGNIVEPLSGRGQLIDICAVLE
jgi:hypothetical protein